MSLLNTKKETQGETDRWRWSHAAFPGVRTPITSFIPPPPFTLTPRHCSLLSPLASHLFQPSQPPPVSFKYHFLRFTFLTTHPQTRIGSPLSKVIATQTLPPDLFLGNFIVHAIPMCILVPPQTVGSSVKTPKAGSLSLAASYAAQDGQAVGTRWYWMKKRKKSKVTGQ